MGVQRGTGIRNKIRQAAIDARIAASPPATDTAPIEPDPLLRWLQPPVSLTEWSE